MKEQRGQSAVEFALMAPLVLFMVLTAIYGGAMFIQFMNYSNEARRIARDIAVTDASNRAALVAEYNGTAKDSAGNTLVGIYVVTLETQLIPVGSDTPTEVQVIFNFDLPEGRRFIPFDFPPEHFAASYHMQLE